MANIVLVTVNKVGHEARLVVDEAAGIVAECKRLADLGDLKSAKVESLKPAKTTAK